MTQIGVTFIDCTIFTFLRIIYTIYDRLLMHTKLLIIIAMFGKKICDKMHYSKLKHKDWASNTFRTLVENNRCDKIDTGDTEQC